MHANFDRRVWHTSGKKTTNFHVELLKVGEKAVEVKFRNGTVAYYHLSCWNDPQYAYKVENIKKQSVN